MNLESEQFKLVKLPGGGNSLRSLVHAETFHPEIGPLAEAKILHVDQQEILKRSQEVPKFILWDVGLGAAANAITAIDELKKSSGKIEIHSFDKSRAPLEFAVRNAEALGYLAHYQKELETLCNSGFVQVAEKIRWYFHEGDFLSLMHKSGIPKPQSVFYDPYSPTTNGEMWTLNHFKSLLPLLDEDCVLTNYTRSTAVRVTLLLAGYFVGKGVSIGKKSQTTVASRNLSLLKNPLGSDWLERVRISGSAQPIRSENIAFGAIEPDDLSALLWHPQFTKKIATPISPFALP